jgi:hypothetical protein
MALIYLRKEIFEFAEVYLIENSAETAEQVAIVKKGILQYKKDNSPDWVNSILYFIERLKNP